MNNKHSKKQYTGGFAALLAVVIIGSAALIVALNASFLGINDLDIGYTSQRGSQAFATADGCIEETFRRIRLDTNYGVVGGTINLSLTKGSCTIDVVASSTDRIITVTGTVDDYNRKIEANISLSGSIITLNSWEEKDD